MDFQVRMIPGIKVMSLLNKRDRRVSPSDYHCVIYRGTKVLRPHEVKEHHKIRKDFIKKWLDANTQGRCSIANGYVDFEDYDEALLFYLTFK